MVAAPGRCGAARSRRSPRGCDRDAGGHERPAAAGREHRPLAGEEVDAGVARAGRSDGSGRSGSSTHDRHLAASADNLRSAGAGVDGPRDDRPRPGARRHRRDRHARHRRRARRSWPRDPTSSSTSRPRRSPAWTTSCATCTPSGLLPAIEASTLTLEDAGAATLAFIREHVPEPRTVPLCGNSIGTDRRFLAALPARDRGATSTTARSTCPPSRSWPGAGTRRRADARRAKAGSHRALDDIRESIEELRYYRERVFVAADASGTDDP